jgi:Protein of unknown function (DUF2442)
MKSSDNIEQANRRAGELQAQTPRVVAARYDSKTGRIVIHLSSKLIVSFAPEDAQGMEIARPSQLREIEISPSGFGLHFPAVDADIYVPGLLEGFLGSSPGWRDGWVRSTVRRQAKPGLRHPERMADSEEDRGRRCRRN